MKNTLFDYIKFGFGFYIGWGLANRIAGAYKESKNKGEK